MRTSGPWVLVLASMLACTRNNPAFEGGDDEGTGSASDTGSTTGDDDEPTTEGRTSTDDGESSPQDATTTGEPGTCDALEFPPAYTIDAEPGIAEVFGLGCPSSGTIFIDTPLTDGTTVSGSLCFPGPEPGCGTCTEAVSLGFGMSLPSLPECLAVTVALGPECEVLAYALGNGHEILPLEPFFVASNRLAPNLVDIPWPGPGLDLAEASTTSCGEACGPPLGPRTPGTYALVTGDGTPIAPGDEEGFDSYTLVNDGSGIDASCEPVIRWRAAK